MDFNEAVRLQERLARKIRLRWEGGRIRWLAGADVACSRDGDRLAAAVVVLSFPELRLEETAVAFRKARLPYIPGFLSFREGPPLLAALARLRTTPDVTLLDGNGIAHPRRLGLASHIGVLLDIATIGCAKSPFYPFREPGDSRGAWTLLRDRGGERVGCSLRTRRGVKPVFVSPGHRVDFRRSRDIVLACSRFRIPEPLRLAHQSACRARGEA